MNLNFLQLDDPISWSHLTMLVVEDVRIFSNLVRDLYHFDDAMDLKLYDDNFKSAKASELLLSLIF
ncbi:hypothetical protein FACS1894193_09110 [Bacilli bacterium]|nr:hypothetical protein FACS1894193_09110 [Bacilli bacterium]